MSQSYIKFWIRKTDMERFFAAKRICYLVGGYDGSGSYLDISELAANLHRLSALTHKAHDIMLAPLIYWRHMESHKQLCERYSNLFGDSCFVYHTHLDDSEYPAALMLQERGMAELVDPPSVHSQILLYGSTIFNGNRGRADTKLETVDSLEDWLRIANEEEAELRTPLLLVGQRISADFVSDLPSKRFANVLERAYAVGVKDEGSFEAIADQYGTNISSKLFISGDDVASAIMLNGWKIRNCRGQDTQSGRQKGSHSFTLNIHLSLEDHATENLNRVCELIVTILRHVNELLRGSLVINLIAADEDRQMVENTNLRSLEASFPEEDVTVNNIRCIEGLRDGLSSFPTGDLTISCSYVGALTSLILSVPTILLHDNRQGHQHEDLREVFGIPSEMLVNIEKKSLKELNKTLKKIVVDRCFRTEMSRSAARGSSTAATRGLTTATLLGQFLASGYIDSLEKKYRGTVDKLLESTEQLSNLQFDYTRLLNLAQKAHRAGTALDKALPMSVTDYQRLIRRVCDAVRSDLPPECTVLVVSRGDEELLKLEGRRAWHFPQAEDGAYAGYHPANSAEAIEHLEELRAKGADFLLFPSTAFWWLEYYGELKRHLDSRYQRIRDDEYCIIYKPLVTESTA